jgi:uncharacterized coiled-coil DUF342 family protein
MGEDERVGSTPVNENGPRDPEELRADIEETRRELGDTVAALSAKTDVKAQAKDHVEEVKTSINEKRDELIGKAQELGGKAREISPESVQQAASTGTTKARENPLPVAAVAAFGAGFLLGRLTSR